MAKRNRIGLLYGYSEHWIGGTYYILNVIRALSLLNDDKKPELIIFYYNDEKLNFVKDIKYPYLKYCSLNTKYKLVGLFIFYIKKIFKINLIAIRNFFLVKNIFLTWHNDDFKYIKNKICWVPDFQESRLEHFFSKKQIEDRSSFPKFVSKKKKYKLVLSSYDSLNDFQFFYKGYKCKTVVVQFASSLPAFENIEINNLYEKFNIHKPYFICSNQLWQHKNHITILKAVKYYIETYDENILIVFTGKNADYRTEGYFETLKKYIKDNKLENYIKFLGFIKREEQLQLMKNSLSIIQPSLFEGWSTTVEDAKAISKNILLSSIPVHCEQISQNVSFFKPEDYVELSELMRNVVVKGVAEVKIDYKQNIITFAENFINTIKK